MREDFKIPPAKWPDEKKIIDTVTTKFKAALSEKGSLDVITRFEVPENIVKSMAEIATNAWKAKGKMVDSASGEVREEMKRVYRHIESMFESFQVIGLEIKDHTGDSFDYGLPLKVVTTQPTQGISKERVVETIRPT